ncbi:hypothetical protein TESG_00442 [Trichophyton tonsurans CBS 112818]|uniref:25S rRNA (uridine-N(3))-methyltransferase BMT5-like domain-containing protein n=1 Tax=Trichophyton tonsurans (strain CBS 112818) TaxID=647933 RepID=F2RNH5_TRIT1|nr:hypothetical protein TESG_00442 [Trichophyton tonsurans CBS 112818]
MGKNRKPTVKQSNKKMKSFTKLSTSTKKTQNAKQQQQKQNQPQTPFRPEAKLFEKYPDAKRHIEQLEAFSSQSQDSKAGVKRKRDEEVGSDQSDEETDQKPQDHVKAGPVENGSSQTAKSSVPSPKVVFSIDARKLGATGGGGKLIRSGFPAPSPKVHYSNRSKKGSNDNTGEPGGPWDIICFNFPHVGGLSTDVNRQVRSNQELLVGFFKACVPLLSVPNPTDDWSDFEDEDEYTDEEENDDSLSDAGELRRKPRKEPGHIIVTLFEGEPYTLWNIRDLARHAGLRVVTSFKFPWASYPGYSHARTIGAIEGKDGGRGGWKGEEREARSYVFERKGFEGQGTGPGKLKRKRNGSGSESD